MVYRILGRGVQGVVTAATEMPQEKPKAVPKAMETRPEDKKAERQRLFAELSRVL